MDKNNKKFILQQGPGKNNPKTKGGNIMKLKNIQMETMLETLKPILPHRDKIGYIAARNARTLNDALTEYFIFKGDLIKKYGEVDKDENGNELGTMSIRPNSDNFETFEKEFDEIKNIEHEVKLMTVNYEDIIGLLNGEEILKLDWMLVD